jgi:uncharacterized protein YqjF (DUF2071 family)
MPENIFFTARWIAWCEKEKDETYTMRSDEKKTPSIYTNSSFLFFILLTASFVQQIEQRNSASVYTYTLRFLLHTLE